MVDDQQIAEAPHPVGVHDAPSRHRPHRLPGGGANEHALRLDSRPPWSAEPPGQFPAHRRDQPAAQLGKRLIQRSALHDAPDAFDETREARLVGAQHADLPAPFADIGADTIQYPPALAPLGDDGCPLGARGLLDRK